jgi:hypothetical protein
MLQMYEEAIDVRATTTRMIMMTGSGVGGVSNPLIQTPKPRKESRIPNIQTIILPITSPPPPFYLINHTAEK